MSNGKRWTILRAGGGNPDIVLGPEVEAGHGVDVMEVSQHNADLESLAQELERRVAQAAIEESMPGGCEGDTYTRKSYEEAAQLARAKIEEGDRG